VSMAGGTICFIEKGFTVRVPELRSSTTLAVTRCEKHGKGVLRLDNAFSRIEGHPKLHRGVRAGHASGKKAKSKSPPSKTLQDRGRGTQRRKARGN